MSASVAGATAAPLARCGRRPRRRRDGSDGVVGSVGHAARRRTREPRPPALRPPADRHRGAVLGRRRGRRRQPAVPVAPHALVLLGPARRLRRRGRRRLLRAHARDRVVVGPAGLGRLVDVGRPADLDRAAAAARNRLPRAPPRPGRPRGPGSPLRRGGAARRRRRADRALLRPVVADAAPGRHRARPRVRPPRARDHALDARPRVRRLLVDLRLAARRPLPGRGPAGRRGWPGARGLVGGALERGHRARRCRGQRSRTRTSAVVRRELRRRRVRRRARHPLRLRGRPGRAPEALGAGAPGLRAAGRRDAAPRRTASGRERHDHRVEPAFQPAAARRHPGSGAPPGTATSDEQAGPGGLRAPDRGLRLPAGRGPGQLAQLLRHGRPGLRAPGVARHPDLPSGGDGRARHHPLHLHRFGLHDL